MKKSAIQTILGLICFLSLIFACGEGETFTSQVLWSGGWLAVCAISGKLLGKTFTKEDMEEKA